MPENISLEEAIRQIDFNELNKGVVWSVNSPRCLCVPCYRRWLDWGKRLLGSKDKFYLDRVKKEKFHRQQMRMARQLATRPH